MQKDGLYLPWSAPNKPRSISAAVELGFGSSILIGTANRQEEGIKPDEGNGHYDRKPLKGSTQQGDQMWYVLQKRNRNCTLFSRIQQPFWLKSHNRNSGCILLPEKVPQAVKSVEDQSLHIWQPAG